MGPQVVAALVNPVSQRVPFGEQRFVGYFDGGGTGGGITVERQQPSVPIHRENVPHSSQRLEIRNGDSASGVTGPFSEGDQLQKHLPGSSSVVLVETGIEFFGTLGERTGDTTDIAVGLDRQVATPPGVEHLGQRILQQG